MCTHQNVCMEASLPIHSSSLLAGVCQPSDHNQDNYDVVVM